MVESQLPKLLAWDKPKLFLLPEKTYHSNYGGVKIYRSKPGSQDTPKMREIIQKMHHYSDVQFAKDQEERMKYRKAVMKMRDKRLLG